MIIPTSVQQLVEDALLMVKNHPQHALVPMQRSRIYDAIGSLNNPTSHQIRGRLALACAYRVLPIWHRDRPHDDMAEYLVSLVEQVLLRKCDQEIAAKELQRAWNWVTNDYEDRTDELSDEAMSALLTVIETMHVALGNDRWEDVTVLESETDADLDAWTSDAALWAAATLAGPVWEQPSDSLKRWEFWKWWLTKAIPSAYKEVS